MIRLYVSAANVAVEEKETLTEGRVGLRCQFRFTDEWAGLAKTAVFDGADSRDVIITGDTVTIPAECLAAEGYSLSVGIYGKNAAGDIVIPTVYATVGKIQRSAYPSGKETASPTPDIVSQIQQAAANAEEMARAVKVDADLGKFNGKNGTDGGWYTPAVTQPDANTMRVSFEPSKEGMPAVADTDVKLPTGGGGGGGEDGGYYTPAVTLTSDDTMRVEFSASKADMPAVAAQDIILPAGPTGPKGDAGDTGPQGPKGEAGADGAPGTDGKSAYQYAQEGGYTGTEEEFAAKLAAEFPDKLPNPNPLTFSGVVTGTYDGSAPLSVEIANLPSTGAGANGADYSFLAGLKYYALGDSIVDMQGTLAVPETFGDSGYSTDLQNRDISGVTVDGYVTAIEIRYGLVATNFGAAGHTLVQDYSSLEATDYSDVALVTIAYGVNDARTGVPLGTVNDTDITTFAGALNGLLKKIYTDNPECRVLVLTPMQRLTVTDFGIATPNANGNYLIDFVDMCHKIAEKRSTICIDQYRNCGINQTNLYYYTIEGVHPVNQGFARIKAAVIGALDELFALEYEPFGTMTNSSDTEPDQPDTSGGSGGEPPAEETGATVVDLSAATVTDAIWRYDQWDGKYSNQPDYACIGPIELIAGKTYTLTAYVRPDANVNDKYWGYTYIVVASETASGGADLISRESTDSGEVLTVNGNEYKKAIATFVVPTDKTFWIYINTIDAIDLSNYSLTYI